MDTNKKRVRDSQKSVAGPSSESTKFGKVRFSLKDHLFNREKTEYLGELFAANDSEFSKKAFVSSVMKKLPALELKQRIVLIAEVLESHLPDHFPAAVERMMGSLPPPLDESKTDDDFGDFIFAPLGEFVVRNGLKLEHLDLSLQAIREITKRFSMEDSIRAFLREFPNQTLGELTKWTQDPNYHVRRLVSESTRPLLPWSGRIDLPVEVSIDLLDRLHADKTRYVTRSVANHLNDIAKSNPVLVVKTLEKWRDLSRQSAKELEWMTRHSLRTLIKKGEPGALKLLGFRSEPKISVGKLRLTQKRLVPGDTLEFSFDITAERDESLVIDYAIDFVKAAGKRSSKVFKAAKIDLKKGQTTKIRKRHKLLANATTFRLYGGEHFLSVQINGQVVAKIAFELIEQE